MRILTMKVVLVFLMSLFFLSSYSTDGLQIPQFLKKKYGNQYGESAVNSTGQSQPTYAKTYTKTKTAGSYGSGYGTKTKTAGSNGYSGYPSGDYGYPSGGVYTPYGVSRSPYASKTNYGYGTKMKATGDLLGDPKLDVVKIKEMASGGDSSNILYAISVSEKDRFKRDLKNVSDSTEKTTRVPLVGEPIIYVGERITNGSKVYALLYSSKSMLLKRNNSEDLHLGKVTNQQMIQYDSRLNVKIIPFEGGIVNVRFSFTWTGNGYWTMNAIKVHVVLETNEYNLGTDKDIMAAAKYSYHCNGETVFFDSKGVELHIYDLQVQPDSLNGKFGDANDCEPFITVPIWSGLFVIAILGIGLIIALTAIIVIKTMDKFDNHKTKNLTITVSE